MAEAVENAVNEVDVLIVGAGISGVCAAYHLQDQCPGKTYTILEARDAMGGTWDLFRYPGIRSDSDMHTLGFKFKPWVEAKAIADGPAIRKYVNETADEFAIRQHIRFGHKMLAADWNSDEEMWTVRAANADGEVVIRANFLMMCSGYYDYDTGYTPDIPGLADFDGPTIHPQHWPEDLDYTNKRVIVIGSGATAMTLVPAMARDAAQVTMVQRSPTYVVSRPDQDVIANTLRKFLPDKWAYAITRFKNVKMQAYIYKRSRTAPERVKAKLLALVRKALPDVDIDKHFTPRYNPWDQRLCLIPNADLYKAIRNGKADVVTGAIDCVTERGVLMQDGQLVEGDVLVTATGLNLKFLGGADFSIDGRTLDLARSYSYKGMMYSDVPNLIQTFGYINASWTLRADLTSEYAARVIAHMDAVGVKQVTPRLRAEDRDMQTRPWIEDFSAGYMQRVMHLFPKQGNRDPWRNTQDYALDKKMVRHAPLEDGALTFGKSAQVIPWPDDAKLTGAGANSVSAG